MYRPTKYFKTVKVFYILYWGFSAILNYQFQTNRTLKEISLHFTGTLHLVQGFSPCSWRYVGNDRNVYL